MSAPSRNGRQRGNGRGQALVEFAIVFPIFALLLFGLIDVGRLVYINTALSQAAREGARWGSVQGRSSTGAGRATIAAHATGVMAAVPDTTATATCERADGSSLTACATNDVLVVSLSTPVTLFTPIVSQIVGTRTVTAVSKVGVNQ